MAAGEDSASAVGARRLTRRAVLRWGALAGGSAVAMGLAPWRSSSASSLLQRDGCSGSGALPSAITAVMQKPRYAGSTWNLLVAEVASGETLYALQPDQIAFTGSVRKLFS